MLFALTMQRNLLHGQLVYLVLLFCSGIAIAATYLLDPDHGVRRDPKQAQE
jgi:hypothetical protein